MLTGNEIKRQVYNGNIFISDFNEEQLSPNSYDLRIGNVFKSPIDRTVFDAHCDNEKNFYTLEVGGDGIVLSKNKLYLASTVERVYTNQYVPMIEGRSSIARLGLSIHLSAGFGDLGFNGRWTLELLPSHPVKIYPGMRVCQVYFIRPDGEVGKLYKGKYQNQEGAISSKIHLDYENDETI